MAKNDPIDPVVTQEPDQSSFKVLGETKIPVSKASGTMWKHRRDNAIKKRKDSKLDEAWAQALRYYKHDQLAHRFDGADGSSKGNGLAERISRAFSETENLVFSNTSVMAPLLYSQNPDSEITAINKELEPLAGVSEKVLDAILNKTDAPGVNLKPKQQRAIISACLTNLAWAEVGWTQRSDSLEQHYDDLLRIAEEYSKSANEDELTRLEGELQVLESTSDLLSNSGPWVKIHPPGNIIRDPQSVEEDLSDANWVMLKEYIPTTALKAKYYNLNKDKNQDVSIYEPTMILADNGSEQEELYSYTPFSKEQTYAEAGYKTQEEFDSKKITVVWKVWDKTTRRVLMYHDKNWTYPIWVWDDPYHLPRFYPFHQLSLHIAPDSPETKGEVSYYLDQQDAINFINSVKNAAISWVGTKFAYDNQKLNKKDAEALIYSDSLSMVGITVPEGGSLKEMMPQAIEHPALKYWQALDKAGLYQTIGQISGVTDVLRGAQFKTNTTNDAINTYSSITNKRLENSQDKVEDFTGAVCTTIMQLCWMNMDVQTVAQLIGAQEAQGWTNLSPEDIRSLSLRVVAGSTVKPTGEAKKKQAIEIAQVLGQFASATPMAVVVALKMLERAFNNEIVITDTDWQMIEQSIAQQLQAASVPPDAAAQSASPEEDKAYNEMLSMGIPPEVARAKAQEVAQKVKQNGQPPSQSKPN